MKKLTKNIIATIISMIAAAFPIWGLSVQIANTTLVKIILILLAIAYGILFPYYIWKRK